MISLWIALLTSILSIEKESHNEEVMLVATVLAQDQTWKFESTPAWADEFSQAGRPDPAKWGYDIGGNGWGNNELQYYTDNIKNAAVANGLLTITGIYERTKERDYSSARLSSKNKGDFLYGRIEVKAKLPTGKGTWPAIWMLPTDWEYGGWPKSGEIDIMEHVGFDQDRVHITVHTESYNHSIGTQVGKNKMVAKASSEFHLYRIDWTPDAIHGYIDDQLLFEFKNDGKGYASWPFDKRFHILLNIAVGGNWGGQKGIDNSIWPQSMQIDYVRYYKLIDN